MSDERKYSLGGGKRPVRQWDDLDHKTRTEIVQQIATITADLAEYLTLRMEAIGAAVRPMVQQLSDYAKIWTAFAQTARQIADFVSRWVPNWSDDVDPEKAWAVTAEGIPLAFVPRKQIVDELIAAEDRDARRQLLLRSKKLILTDCRDALAKSDETLPVPESISMLRPLLLEVFDVLEAGYSASACALGICVVESTLRRTSDKKFDYTETRDESIGTELQEAIAANEFRISLALRPLWSLLEAWYLREQKPLPEMPSRHLVAHFADPEHLTETNAIIIAMTATSLFRGRAEREFVAGRVARDEPGSGNE